MKKLLGIIIINILLSNVSFAIEANKYENLHNRAEKAKGKEVLMIISELNYEMLEQIELMQKCLSEYNLYNNTDGKFCTTFMLNKDIGNESQLIHVGIAVGAEVEKVYETYSDNNNPPEWVKSFAEVANRNMELLEKWDNLNVKLKKLYDN